jgi:hypothetical protein
MGREQVPSLPVFRTFCFALTFVAQHMLDGDSSSSPYGSGLLHQKVGALAFAPQNATESCNRIGPSQPSYPRHCSFNPSLVSSQYANERRRRLQVLARAFRTNQNAALSRHNPFAGARR